MKPIDQIEIGDALEVRSDGRSEESAASSKLFHRAFAKLTEAEFLASTNIAKNSQKLNAPSAEKYWDSKACKWLDKASQKQLREKVAKHGYQRPERIQ